MIESWFKNWHVQDEELYHLDNKAKITNSTGVLFIANTLCCDLLSISVFASFPKAGHKIDFRGYNYHSFKILAQMKKINKYGWKDE